MTSTAPDHPDNAILAESEQTQHLEVDDSRPLAGETSSAASDAMLPAPTKPSSSGDLTESDLSDAGIAGDDLSAVRDEESISDYMERLLTRVNRLTSDDDSKSQPAVAISVAQHSHPPIAGGDAAIEENRPSESSGAAAEEGSRQRFGTTRRALPPERRVDLMTLRSLAKETSRDAIDIHSRQQTVAAASGKLWVATIASVIAMLLLELSSPERLLVCATAAVSVIVSMVFALQFLNQTRMLTDQLRPIPLQESIPESTTGDDALASSPDEHHESK